MLGSVGLQVGPLVVAAAARARLLLGLLGGADELLRGVPLLVLANKTDEPSTRKQAEANVSAVLGIDEVQGRSCKLFGTCCIPFDTRNYEALEWLNNELQKEAGR